MNKCVIVITGPTGSGKTGLLNHFNENYPISVFSCDSRQVYKGLPIITAQPTAAEQARFPHYNVGCLNLNAAYSAGAFVDDAISFINHCHTSARIPIIIGGTFFYIKTLWDGQPYHIEIPPGIRSRVALMQNHEAASLLNDLDPVAAGRIHFSDTYRLHRALEVTLALQETESAPFTRYSERPMSPGTRELFSYHAFCTEVPRARLYENINLRTGKMYRGGGLEEIYRALKNGYTLKDPGLNTIGITEVLSLFQNENHFIDCFEKNAIDEEMLKQIIERVALNTRRFAKRQLTWFRHDERLKRFDPHELISQISVIIEDALKQ